MFPELQEQRDFSTGRGGDYTMEMLCEATTVG